jgi:hypothetical protein
VNPGVEGDILRMRPALPLAEALVQKPPVKQQARNGFFRGHAGIPSPSIQPGRIINYNYSHCE